MLEYSISGSSRSSSRQSKCLGSKHIAWEIHELTCQLMLLMMASVRQLSTSRTSAPSVWYELGYAFASGRPVVMVCSEERTGKKYPFDIQHRSVISYLVEAPGDFTKLCDILTERIKTLLERGTALEKIAEPEPVATLEGLSQAELLVLALVAGDAFLPSPATSLYSVGRSAEQSGLTNVGFSLGVCRLVVKRFVELGEGRRLPWRALQHYCRYGCWLVVDRVERKSIRNSSSEKARGPRREGGLRMTMSGRGHR